MDLNLSEHQQMLKQTARGFLSEHCTKTFVTEMEDDSLGYKPELWQTMADLGWLGLIVPSEYGGVGGNFLDLSVLLEEMGRALLPSPFLSTVISQLILLEAGNKEQKENLLPKIAEGKLIISPAWNEPGTEYDVAPPLKATVNKDNYILSGSTLFTAFAHVANYLVAQAQTHSNATTLFLVNTKLDGLKINPLITRTKDKVFEVEFCNVTVSKDAILGKKNEAQKYLDSILPKVAVSKSMEMLGGAQQVLEMSAEYAKQRIQFSKPIGSFQAIQHHCANMAIDVETSRFLAYKTAWMLSEGMDCKKQAFMTKAWLSDAYRRVVVLGKQIHGGYGIMRDYQMQLYFRQQKCDEVFAGDADYYREKVAAEIL